MSALVYNSTYNNNHALQPSRLPLRRPHYVLNSVRPSVCLLRPVSRHNWKTKGHRKYKFGVVFFTAIPWSYRFKVTTATLTLRCFTKRRQEILYNRWTRSSRYRQTGGNVASTKYRMSRTWTMKRSRSQGPSYKPRQSIAAHLCSWVIKLDSTNRLSVTCWLSDIDLQPFINVGSRYAVLPLKGQEVEIQRHYALQTSCCKCDKFDEWIVLYDLVVMLSPRSGLNFTWTVKR